MPRSLQGVNRIDMTKTSAVDIGYGTHVYAIILRSTFSPRCDLGGLSNGSAHRTFCTIDSTRHMEYWGGSVNRVGTTQLTAGRAYLLVGGKATGNTTPRLHYFDYTTMTWTHENASAAVTDGGTAASQTVRIGSLGGSAGSGDYEAYAFYASNLSDADVERLIFADWTPKTFEGVPFQLVDPHGTKTPNAIMLYGTNGGIPPKMPKSVKLPCNAPVKLLHLLSGVSGWGWPATEKVSTTMIVRLHYADGQTEDHPLKNGEAFADYIRRVDVPGSKFAHTCAIARSPTWSNG